MEHRGAWAEVIGPISDTATSAIVLPHETPEMTGLSYPIGSVPDRSPEPRDPPPER
jgi:hypothetical protein